MIVLEEREDDYVPQTLPEILKGIQHFEVDGNKYILDLNTLQTPEDIIKVLKHFSTKVELRGHETTGIESFVKPISDTLTH